MKLRVNKKRFIYLISPNNIKKNFYLDLEKVLNENLVEFFQLRLKNVNKEKLIYVGKKVKKICKKYNVKFIINDSPYIAKALGSDGCHLGQSDLNILSARKLIKNKIIGITCHNSKTLIKIAIKNKANYIAIGAFFRSKTKKTKFKAKFELINQTKKLSDIPIVAIGGIKPTNYKKLLLHKANFLAISGYIWKNKKLKPLEAIKKFNYEN